MVWYGVWMSGTLIGPQQRGTLHGLDGLVMSPIEAAEELRRRGDDPNLKRRVEEYLNGDIPPYFADGPILYLSRYIATPNFETIRFTHLTEPLGMKVVVGQDSRDIFVTQNEVKRALCKLPLCIRVTQKSGECFEQIRYESITDLNYANGKRFGDIQTHWGEPLMDFHKRLLSSVIKIDLQTPDDADWIDRNHRGDLLAHYKKLLALFVAHGIFFEDYILEDKHEADFVDRILRPAFEHVTEVFGCAPIIAQLVPKSLESNTFWISYPLRVDELFEKPM